MATVKPEPEDAPAFGAVPANPALEEGETKANGGCLQQLVSVTSPELLEDGVNIGVRVLNSLKDPLEAVAALNTGSQAGRWLKSITELEALAKPTRTIVGVVGNTGAGKSSVISAVLDEER